MPFVKIDLFEGRSQEQKNELAREVTEVVSRALQKHLKKISMFLSTICLKEPTILKVNLRKIRNSKRGYPGNLF